jgi:protein farnesyltransferase subunit beta
MFWTVQSFAILQVALDPTTKQKVIDKIMACQHEDGGFGGGPGQAAQLLPSYASVCTLAVVGRPGPGGGWDQIDRDKMYKFFMSLKQKDGSFMVARHSEVDVRGIYSLLIISSMLDILTHELVEGTAEFIASCQTYEGGFASASHPSFSFNNNNSSSLPLRPTLGEAHGGYTFCALASWVLLQPYLASSSFSHHHTTPTINLKNLLRWLTQMQGTEIELGGFKGRTNKLVDGCYSWWCGGSFALLEALGVRGGGGGGGVGIQNIDPEQDSIDESWADIDDGLYDQKALQEYVLYAGQYPVGGLRDKPPKNPDSYHTLYCLSGLSSAQHHLYPSPTRRTQLQAAWKTQSDELSDHDALRKSVFTELLSWTEEEGVSKIVGGETNRLNATHPITNLTITHTEMIMSHFYKQNVPLRKKSVPTPS